MVAHWADNYFPSSRFGGHPQVWAATPNLGSAIPSLGGCPEFRDGHPHVVFSIPRCERPPPGPRCKPATPRCFWRPSPGIQPPPPRCRGAASCPSPTTRAPCRSHYAGSTHRHRHPSHPPQTPHTPAARASRTGSKAAKPTTKKKTKGPRSGGTPAACGLSRKGPTGRLLLRKERDYAGCLAHAVRHGLLPRRRR